MSRFPRSWHASEFRQVAIQKYLFEPLSSAPWTPITFFVKEDRFEAIIQQHGTVDPQLVEGSNRDPDVSLFQESTASRPIIHRRSKHIAYRTDTQSVVSSGPSSENSVTGSDEVGIGVSKTSCTEVAVIRTDTLTYGVPSQVRSSPSAVEGATYKPQPLHPTTRSPRKRDSAVAELVTTQSIIPEKKRKNTAKPVGLFGCFFAKHDEPRYNQVHNACTERPGFTMPRLKEHALTVHGSRFICPRCGTKCYNAKKFKAHGDAQSCQAIRREPSNLEPEVMTLVQEKVLDMGFNAKCSTEEKWRLMYNEFFPQEEQSNCPDPYYSYNVPTHRLLEAVKDDPELKAKLKALIKVALDTEPSRSVFSETEIKEPQKAPKASADNLDISSMPPPSVKRPFRPSNPPSLQQSVGSTNSVALSLPSIPSEFEEQADLTQLTHKMIEEFEYVETWTIF